MYIYIQKDTDSMKTKTKNGKTIIQVASHPIEKTAAAFYSSGALVEDFLGCPPTRHCLTLFDSDTKNSGIKGKS